MLTRIRTTPATLLLAATAIVVLTATAPAQTVTYVSSNGNNANACTREAPCRTVARGIKATPAGGELQILNSGAYGNAVKIGKSITISAIGISATVGGIVINGPNAAVALRGLLIKGSGAPGVHGILVEDAAAVHIAGCEVEGFAGAGIAIGDHNAEIFVAATVVRNSGYGLLLGGGRTSVDNSRFENNLNDGIQMSVNTAKAAFTGVTASGNGASGFFIASADKVTIESSMASRNVDGGLRVNGGVVSVSNSAFTDHTAGVGLQRTGGTLYSRGNNTVHSNAADTSGTITPLAGK